MNDSKYGTHCGTQTFTQGYSGVSLNKVSRDLRLSETLWDIVRLIRLKVITYDDLSDFSDELQMEVKEYLR